MTKPDAKIKQREVSNLDLTESALRILEARYLKKDIRGNLTETPEEMFRRVANAVASAELSYDAKADIRAVEDEFYRIMANLEFLPNSPTLINAGRKLGQLSACFVLPVDDSMELIFDAVRSAAIVQKSGGGTGFSFSRVRPENDRVKSTGGVASGPVSFMRVFDVTTDVVSQGGMRRGANMAILDERHPDIMKFVMAKNHFIGLANFNLSVAVTDEFMDAVIVRADYNLVNPRSRKVVGELNARDVFDKIVALAWETGDPGLVFIDRVNECNPTPKLGRIEGTNPCGEQPLLPYESCNLGCVNLSRMIRTENSNPEIDYRKLGKTVRVGIRFLDNVIEVNKLPLKKIEEMTKKTRKIGIGVMGFADMLIQLNIPYDSEKAIKVASNIMEFINKEAIKASAELAEKRGAFPSFKGSIYDVVDGKKLRNATCTTIPPSGTLSIIAGCSSGIEPLYSLVFQHNILNGSELLEINPYFEEIAKLRGFYSNEIFPLLAQGTDVNDIEEVPDDVKRLFATAHKIAPEIHVRIQAAFQQHIQNAVSKTVNLPQKARLDDVAKIYLLAYKEGLKGITIYRDGSLAEQPLSTGQTTNLMKDQRIMPRQRPDVLSGISEKLKTGCGNIYITVNSDEQGRLFEIFANLGKAGGCPSAQLEAIARLVTLSLRSGIPAEEVVEHLKYIRCPSPTPKWDGGVFSCADAIAIILDKHSGGNRREKTGPKTHGYRSPKTAADLCPECGSFLIYQEGCHMCRTCGYNRC